MPTAENSQPGRPHSQPPRHPVDVVLPCRDEAAALPDLLRRIALLPGDYRAVVVDNGSSDGSGAVAAAHGALVIHEPQPGYGAAVQAGLIAARSGPVAVMDADGSLDPADLPALVELVLGRAADLAVGRRRPAGPGAWPVHARAGTALVAARLRRRGIAVHDIAPLRVGDRDRLIALGVADRRSGYPVELLLRAGEAGWRIAERDVAYHRRAVGTRSKVSGSFRGTVTATRDFAAVLGSRTVTPVTVLVVAKAPEPGRVKTRLAASIGTGPAADLAAAALLDTLQVAGEAAKRLGNAPPVVALTGDLGAACRRDEILAQLRRCHVIGQRGTGLAARLAAAHADAGGRAGGAVLQIGMDTPQVDADLLASCAGMLTSDRGDAVLGPALDGGWWVLGVLHAAAAQAVRSVPMSTARTGILTRTALTDSGCTVLEAPRLRDVDVLDDAIAVAGLAPWTRFATTLSATLSAGLSTPLLATSTGRAS